MRKHVHVATPVVASANSQSFRRTDGGRFSMRSPAVGRKLQPEQVKKTEMTAAWLRRKQYDPRKQAAAGSLSSTKKTVENDNSTAYLTNKSRSFHHGDMENRGLSVAKQGLGSRKAPRNSSEQDFKERNSRKETGITENLVADFSRNMAAELAHLTEIDNGNDEEAAVEISTGSDLQALLDKENYAKLMQLSEQLGSRTKQALDIIQSQSMSASMDNLVSTASALSEPELTSRRTHSTKDMTVELLLSQMQQASEAFNAVNKYLTEVHSGRASNVSDDDPDVIV